MQEDKEFAALSIPLADEEMEKLEQSILQEGCREPIITWNGLILDGYKRFRFCKEEGISISAEEKPFPSKEDAVSWICRSRLQDCKAQTMVYRYLVGNLYNAQKTIISRTRKNPEEKWKLDIYPEGIRVSEYIGRELGLNRATVERYRMIANGLEKINEKSRTLYKAIMTGKVKLLKMEVQEISELEESELIKLAKKRWNIPEETVKIRRRERRKPVTDETKFNFEIKNMPVYDPDSELRGAMYTIPTWIMSISRLEPKIEKATDSGRAQLARNLEGLKAQIEKMLTMIEECEQGKETAGVSGDD